MSKRFLRILTICSLVLIVPAIVVASAICLTTAMSYTVSVDTVITNNDLGFANATVQLNGEAKNKIIVKKGSNVVISFEPEAEYASIEGVYVGTTSNAVEFTKDTNANTATCVIENVTKDLQFRVVFNATEFHKVKTEAVDDKGAALNDTSTITGKDLKEVEEIKYVARGSSIHVTAGQILGYRFKNWQNNISNKEFDTAVMADATYTAVYEKVGYLPGTIHYKVNGAEHTNANEIAHGAALETIEDSYDNGVVRFVGWEYNGKVYTTADFDDDAAERTLTAVFTKQSDLTYKFEFAATDINEATTSTVNYNSVTGINVQAIEELLDVETFYTIKGLNIGGTTYNIINGQFVQPELLNKAIFELGTDASIVATPVWGWIFNTLQYEVRTESVSDEVEGVDINLAEVNVFEALNGLLGTLDASKNYTITATIEIDGTKIDNVTWIATSGAEKTATFADVLNGNITAEVMEGHVEKVVNVVFIVNAR